MINDVEVNFYDFYSFVLWEPQTRPCKGISASFFFKCICQLSVNRSNIEYKLLLDRIYSDLESILREMDFEINCFKREMPNACLIKNKRYDSNAVLIKKAPGFCKENALLLKTVIRFDELICLVHKLCILRGISIKKYYRLRRHWGRRIRSIFEINFYRLKCLHMKKVGD